MAFSAPPKKKKLTALSRPFTDLVVWMGADDGSAATSADETEYLQPLKIERVGSGSRLNVATLEYDLTIDEEHVVDTLAPKAVNRQVEIREVDLHGTTKRILHWGKLAAQPISIDANRESVTYLVRIDKHHFGDPLGQVPFWNSPEGGIVQLLDRPLVFNPEIDEVIKPNKSDETWTDRDDMNVWFDAAAINSTAARALHNQTPAMWRLYEAVHALIWLLNPDETFIKNPNPAEINAQIGTIDSTSQRLKNLSLETGKFLNELLDDLLNPFGCSWTIDIEEDTATGLSIRRFRFFVRNDGTQRELFLQRPGEKLDPVKSFVPETSMTYDVATMANKVIGCTSRKLREGTFPLQFGWPVTQDSIEKDQLEQDPDVKAAAPHAGHKLILNEGGTWTGLRPEITTYYDLVDLFDGDDTLVTCRKFKPCISRHTDGNSDRLESRGIWLEWREREDGVWGDWQHVTWSYSVLELECGIWLEQIPTRMWNIIQDDPSNVEFRVTASIEGDKRTYATADRTEESPNADAITLRLNLGDKFHDRKVHSSSRFVADSATADEVDDTLNLQAYVTSVRNLEDAAELSLSVKLEGIDHPEYQIGDLITKINGRNIELNRNNPGIAQTKRYLQILGITYVISAAAQSMELLLESFDEERAF